jgi:hypothetical protein
MVMRCDSCQLARINGIVCHETGCPDSHRFTLRECKWCGTEFAPEERKQRFCEDSCARAYYQMEAEEAIVDEEAEAQAEGF